MEELCVELEKLRVSQKSKRAKVARYEEDPIQPPKKKTAYPSITGCTQPRLSPESTSPKEENSKPTLPQPINTITNFFHKPTFSQRCDPTKTNESKQEGDIVDLVDDSTDPFFDSLEDDLIAECFDDV